MGIARHQAAGYRRGHRRGRARRLARQAGRRGREDQVLADVMTDKATVEMPVAGRRHGGLARRRVGEMLAVGAELVAHRGRGCRQRDRSAACARRQAGAPRRPPNPRRRTGDRNAAAAGPDAAHGPTPATPPKPPSAALGAATARRPRASGARAAAPRAARRQAARLAGGAAARLGRRHRAAVACRAAARRAASRTRISTPIVGAGAGRCRRRRRRRCAERHGVERVQVIGLRRTIARADAGGQAPHPALHLCRGDRRHRARGAARAAQRAMGRRARPSSRCCRF